MDKNSEKNAKNKLLRTLVCDFTFENLAREKGAILIAGADEAGSGPLFSVVTAGACILPPPDEFKIQGIRDSKLVSAKKRIRLAEEIRECAIAWAVADVDAATIDRINILEARKLAMMNAIKALSTEPDCVLIDGINIPIDIPQMAIVHGDALSVSIAAGSILAKVHRDELMLALDLQFPGYGIAKHKGYATLQHVCALEELGPTPEHRMSFRPVREAAEMHAKAKAQAAAAGR